MCTEFSLQSQADNFLRCLNPSLTLTSPATGQASPESEPERARGHDSPRTCGSKTSKRRSGEKLWGRMSPQASSKLTHVVRRITRSGQRVVAGGFLGKAKISEFQNGIGPFRGV